MDGSLTGKEVLVSAERLEVANRKTPIPFLVGRFHKRDRDGNPYYDVKSAVLDIYAKLVDILLSQILEDETTELIGVVTRRGERIFRSERN